MLSEASQTFWAVQHICSDHELNSHTHTYICVYMYIPTYVYMYVFILHVYGHPYAFSA